MTTSIGVSIIIVNWKSAQFVHECVQSLYQFTAGLSYEIIVIDNASFDECERMLREHYPEVIYIQSHTNVGFARANNRASLAARGANLLFLNPDTKVEGPAIMRMHEALSQLPQAGIIGARLLNGDGSLQTSCIQAFPTVWNQMLDSALLRTTWPGLDLWGMAPLWNRQTQPQEVDVISGACLMVRKTVFEQIGRFSEEYAMYAEDADLCLKSQRAGWKNYYVPQAVVVHFGGNSSQQAGSTFSAVMMRESIWQFISKHRGAFSGGLYRGAMIFSAFCRLALSAAAYPLMPLSRLRLAGSLRKWGAILRWALKFELAGMPQPEIMWPRNEPRPCGSKKL